MIIVSQEKDELVNFDRIESIWINTEGEGRFTIEATADTNSTLGIYSTEERAKEVLEKIVTQKAIFEFFKNVPERTQISLAKGFKEDNTIFDTYEMPEK